MHTLSDTLRLIPAAPNISEASQLCLVVESDVRKAPLLCCVLHESSCMSWKRGPAEKLSPFVAGRLKIYACVIIWRWLHCVVGTCPSCHQDISAYIKHQLQACPLLQGNLPDVCSPSSQRQHKSTLYTLSCPSIMCAHGESAIDALARRIRVRIITLCC